MSIQNEYISKQVATDAVPEELMVDFMDEFGAGFNSCRNDMLRSIESLTPADVAPVVHGKWMKEDRGRVEYCAVCDQCGFDWMWSDRGYFKFCPNCGAKMDGEADENG